LLEVDHIRRNLVAATTSATAFFFAHAYKADCQVWKPPAAIPCGKAANLGLETAESTRPLDAAGAKNELIRC